MQTVEDVVLRGHEFLSQLPNWQRIVVAVRDGDQLVVRAATGLEEVDAPLPLAFFDQVMEKGKGVLVLDASKDAKVQLPDGILSALCSPIVDAGGAARGVLYADSLARPGAFAYGHLFAADQLARQLGPALVSAVPASPLPAEPAAGKPPLVPIALIGAALLWALFGSLVSSGRKLEVERVESTPTIVTATTADPQAVVRSFLACLQQRNPAGAYRLLSQSHQRRLSEQDFTAEIETWMGVPENAWALSYRRAGPAIKLGDTVAEVEIEPGEDKPGKTWKWTLVLDDEGWRVDRLQLK
ncbi:MAG: hypothetical protein KC910_22875 [Candidatus Eremiobacteraeota bacterium]|nr:hypothetical protein [Candidatus Eremiobacteraeota bacterium]